MGLNSSTRVPLDTCRSVLSPLVAEEIVVHRLSLDGMSVVCGFLRLVTITTAVSVWHASTFGYLFVQTQA